MSLFSRTTRTLLLSFFFAFSVFGFASQVKADADISQCGLYLGGPSTYTLTQSIGTAGETCLHIVTPDVVITDGGNGYSIDGNIAADAAFSSTDGFGFTVSGNTIINGDISSQGNGGSNGNIIFNESAHNNGNITADAEFNDGSFNTGSVSGNASYNGLTGYDSNSGVYYVGGQATDGLDSNGTGSNTNDSIYYIAGVATTLDSNGTGYNTNDSTYYVNGVAYPGLDSNGTGYNTNDSTYYVNGVAYPGLQNIFTVLPPVTKLSPIKLTPVLTFGDTTNKNSFSLGEGISNFLFAPVSQTFTQTLGKELNKYLTQAGFSKEQDVATIKNKPLLLPKATTTIPGLFTITTKSLPIKLVNQDFTTDNIVPVSTYLTSDKTTLQQKVTTTSNTQITITLKAGKTATFNNQTLTFTKDTLTLTTPTKPGTYTLTTPSSPLTLIIEVVAPKSASVQQTTSTPISWFTKLLNLFHF